MGKADRRLSRFAFFVRPEHLWKVPSPPGITALSSRAELKDRSLVGAGVSDARSSHDNTMHRENFSRSGCWDTRQGIFRLRFPALVQRNSAQDDKPGLCHGLRSFLANPPSTGLKQMVDRISHEACRNQNHAEGEGTHP